MKINLGSANYYKIKVLTEKLDTFDYKFSYLKNSIPTL